MTKPETKPEPETEPEATAMLEPDDALALWTWVWSELEGPSDDTRRSRAEAAAGLLDILTFLACELSLAGRHEWVARLPDMLRLHRGFGMYEVSPQHKCLEALADLLHLGAPVTKSVQAMARSRNPSVRAAVANGLRINDPDARPLLEALSTDGDRHVRRIARMRLPPGQPTAWWVGKFRSDPIPRLTEVDDDVLAALRTAALFVDRERSDEQQAMLPELVEALALLPTPILFELVQRFVDFDWLAPGYAPMLDELLRRPQGASTLWAMLLSRLDRPHEWAHHYVLLGQLCHDLSSQALEQMCQGLLHCVVEHRQHPRAHDMTQLVEGLLCDHWSPSLPSALLLDAWEVLAGDTPEIARTLVPLLSRAKVDMQPEFARLLPLAEGDDALIPALSSLVSRLDPEPRYAFVVRGLASKSAAVQALALRQLVTLPLDPAQGSGQAVFNRHWAEPALRRVIRTDARLCEAFCPHLRRQLRAGALDLSEVAATLQAVGRLWGGTDHVDRKGDGEDNQSARLERAAAWHEGTTETGPPTEEEWAIWRAQRRQELGDRPHVKAGSLLLVRPPGPLDLDDLYILDWLMARWRLTWAESDPADLTGPAFHQTMGLHFGLYGIEDPHVLRALEEVLDKARVLDEFAVEMIEEQVRKLRHALSPDEG